VRSARCQWEVDRTVELGKRLIPVQWIKTDEAEIPERLRRLNYIISGAGQPFAPPLAELANALRQDVEWIRVHTGLGEQAARWQTREEGAQADERQEIALTHTKANVLAELSTTKLSRGEFDSGPRFASHGTRIDLALPPDAGNASPAAAALAAAVSAADWRSALVGHDNYANSAAFSSDGSRIVTASDNTARIWDVHLQTMSAKSLPSEA